MDGQGCPNLSRNKAPQDHSEKEGQNVWSEPVYLSKVSRWSMFDLDFALCWCLKDLPFTPLIIGVLLHCAFCTVCFQFVDGTLCGLLPNSVVRDLFD